MQGRALSSGVVELRWRWFGAGKTPGVNWLDGANHTATVGMDCLISVQLQPKAKGFAVATVV